MLWTTVGISFSIATQLVLGQSSPSTTASSAIPTQTVNVGAEGLVFTPNSITANAGDIIEFRFYPQNHSVARSDYKSPCIPYEDTGVGRQGFWSGFRPTSVVLDNPPIFQVTVNDTNPIFFYCSAPGACIDDGMIGVINPSLLRMSPNSTETLEVQQAFAKNATLMFSPGQYFPSEIAPTSSSVASSTSTSSTSTSATSTPTSAPPTAASSDSSSSKLSTGAIAGIAIGGSVVLMIAAVLLYLCGRQRTIGEILQQYHNPPPPPLYLSGPGHPSIASSAPKMTRMEGSPLSSPNRYSSPTGMYTRSAAETESYRSRSPPYDETREAMIGSLSLNSPAGHHSPTRGGSPLIRRPVPQSPGRMNTIPNSPPFTPMTLPYQDEPPHQPLASATPSALRVSRLPSQQGPHELSVESDRNYLPYQSPDFPRNERIGLGG